MHIPDTNIFQTGLFSRCFAAKGMGFGCRGKIAEIKLRVKRQKAVRDIRVETGNKQRDFPDFGFIHIPGNQQRTGNKKRGVGSLIGSFG